MKEKTLCLANNITEIPRLAGAVRAFGEKHNLAEEVIHHMHLALEEIITNIIRYAYTDEEKHEIAVYFRLDNEAIALEVHDDGIPFNPLSVPVADVQKPLEEREIGGLGIHLVRNVIDTFQYRRERNNNILIMKKKL